jgi:hypothetical protein
MLFMKAPRSPMSNKPETSMTAAAPLITDAEALVGAGTKKPPVGWLFRIVAVQAV